MTLLTNTQELYDEEAETMTIGSILKSPVVMDTINNIVNASDFYMRSHQILFATIKELYDQNKLDFPTIRQWLKDQNKMEEVGGIDYVGQLKLSVPTLHLVSHYADRVKACAIKRNVMQATYEIQNMVLNDEFVSTDALVTAVNTRFGTIEMSKKGRMVSLKKVIDQHIHNKLNNKPVLSPLIGISTIDEWMKGIGRNRLIVVAGRPGNGKTAFSLKTARNVASQGFGPVPIFSLEMDYDELIDRMMADVTAIPFSDINRCNLGEREKSLVMQSRDTFLGMDLFFDDTPSMTLSYISNECRRLKREHGSLGMIAIDYLGLVSLEKRQGENESTAIGRVTSGCKQLAREIGCSVLLLCQMNREIEKRNTKRPVMSDLRDSGSIEQDADMVIFLHKDEEKSSAMISHIDFIVAKGRQTGLRDFELAFYGQVQRMTLMVRP